MSVSSDKLSQTTSDKPRATELTGCLCVVEKYTSECALVPDKRSPKVHPLAPLALPCVLDTRLNTTGPLRLGNFTPDDRTVLFKTVEYDREQGAVYCFQRERRVQEVNLVH